MVFCTEFLDGWWSWEPLYRSCVRCRLCRATRELRHDQRSGSQNHHPSKNSVQKTICCNSISNASDDGRLYPKHVELRIHSFISIQLWRPGLAGTTAQSCDRYGSGTLHPGQVLGGSLPLFSHAFRRSLFSRQVPPSATTREILAAKGGTVGEKDVR